MPQQHLLSAQYKGVIDARQALFNQLAKLDYNDLLKPVVAFNQDTVISKLVHTANVYRHWLLYYDREVTGTYYEDEAAKSINDLHKLFFEVDLTVEDFITRYTRRYETPFTKQVPAEDIVVTTTPTLLFTHVVTHEFHHKGQIMTMLRLLGYTPGDADIIRF